MKIFIQNLFITVGLGMLFLHSATASGAGESSSTADAEACSGVLNHEVRYLNNSKRVRLCEEFAGKLMLVVNTASKCAYTDQYEGLEALYDKYRDSGLVVVGFPSNDFGSQEPGTEKQIQNFCRLTYSVNFPMFAKTRVRKDNADALYRDLAQTAGRYPAWNFHKYLVGKTGELIADFPSRVEPFDTDLIGLIESNL